MRIEALRLEHYGAFAQRNLQLGGKAPLTVVYGPNEAGKSTSLSAVKDFLFGLPNQTPRMAVFGGDAIRLSATLRRADGTVLTLRRRKGRVRTLTDENGAPDPRPIWWTAISRQPARTSCGSPTSPTSRPRRASSIWRLSWMSGAAGSSAGRWPTICEPSWFWMP